MNKTEKSIRKSLRNFRTEIQHLIGFLNEAERMQRKNPNRDIDLDIEIANIDGEPAFTSETLQWVYNNQLLDERDHYIQKAEILLVRTCMLICLHQDEHEIPNTEPLIWNKEKTYVNYGNVRDIINKSLIIIDYVKYLVAEQEKEKPKTNILDWREPNSRRWN